MNVYSDVRDAGSTPQSLWCSPLYPNTDNNKNSSNTNDTPLFTIMKELYIMPSHFNVTHPQHSRLFTKFFSL